MAILVHPYYQQAHIYSGINFMAFCISDIYYSAFAFVSSAKYGTIQICLN